MSMFALGGMVLKVLAEVAFVARLGDSLDVFRQLH